MIRRTLYRLQATVQIVLAALLMPAAASWVIDMPGRPAFGQNVEGQIIASQYGQWQLQGTQTNSFVFSPAACQVKGGNKNFSALKQGNPVRIVDPGNSALDETLIAGLVNIQACSVQLRPVNRHNPPFYLTSGTAGLQEAINANQTANGPNNIILSADWYRQGGSAEIIASVTGIPTLSLVDITTTPYTWYEWNGSRYTAVPMGGGGSPGGLTGAIQYNYGGSFGGSAITGLVKGNGTNAPTAAVPGTDYQAPLGYTPANVANNLADLTSASSARINLGLGTSPQLTGILNSSPSTQLSAALIPTLNQNTTGNAATATALATTPSQCPGSLFATGIGSNGNANCAAQATGVPSVNGVAGPVTMAASGTGLSVSTVGNVVTYSINGAAGTGAVSPAAQYACGEYPAAGTTIAGAGNCYILPVGLNTTQINTFMAAVESASPNGASVIIQNGDNRTPFTGYANIRIVDLRTSAPVEPRSVTEFGAECDAVLAFGTVTSGSSLLNINSGYSFASTDIGKWISMAGSVSGLQTRFDAQITAINSSSQAVLGANAPFSASDYSITIGHDDTAAISAGVTASHQDAVLSFPAAGVCWSRTSPVSVLGQSLRGQGADTATGALLGGAGMDTMDVQGGATGQEIQHLGIFFDGRIDATKPWNFDDNGTITSETPLYRPVALMTPYANDPLGPGWVRGSEPYGLGAYNGVAATTSGGSSICVLTPTIPPAGSDIVFPQYAGGNVVHTTVSSVGSACTGGTTVNLASGTGLEAAGQNEFFFGEAPGAAASGTAVQEIATAIPATGRTFPMQINLENPINPEPGAESDFAPFGLVKIDGEDCQYYQTSSYPNAGGQWLRLTSCAQNGTTAAAHAVGAAIVPLNPFEPTYPWPVSTINGTGNQTPASAEYFPAWNLGNAAIAQPLYDGSTYPPNTGFGGAHIHDLQIQLWPIRIASGSGENPYNFAGTNSTVGIYTVMLPFNTRFDHIFIGTSQNEGPPQFGIFEGVPSVHTHSYFANGNPTADTNTWKDISIRAGYDFDFLGGSTGKYEDFQLFGSNGPPATGWYPYTPATWSGSGAGGIWSAFGPDDTVGLARGQYSWSSMCYDSVINNIYLESEDGALNLTEPSWVMDCNSSTWNGQGDINGGAIFIDGTGSHYSGGPFNNSATLPVVVNANDTTIDYAAGLSTLDLGNAWGGSSVLVWGSNTCVSGPAAGGDSRLSYGNCPAKQPGQTQEFALFGNLSDPFENMQSGFFPADTLNPVSQAGSAIGYTFDASGANLNQGYEGCAAGTGVNTVQCNLFLNGRTQIEPEIGPGQVFAPTKYLMTIGVRECNAYPCTDSAQTFGMYLQGSSSGWFDTSHTAIPITTTWTNVPVGIVDLSSYSGQSLSLTINGTSAAATNIELGYVSLVPLPRNFTAQQFSMENGSTWTSGSSAPTGSCTSGSIYTNSSGSPNTLYVCQSGSWVGK